MLTPGICWLSFVCLLTLIGNILVILAVYRETSLHCATYYYVVSLSVADLCVGILVIPLAILFEYLSSPPSIYFCHLWHIADVGASTASILALCVIALDRYIAITSPINYRRSFLARHSSLIIGLIWFCSALIAGPMLIILANTTKSKKEKESEIVRCEFPSDPVFLIVSSLVSFYIPFLIMVFVYGRILIVARKQILAVRQGFKRTTIDLDQMNEPSPFIKRFRFNRNPPLRDIPLKSNQNSSEKLTLRIHQGKYSRSPSLPLSKSFHRLTKFDRRRTWSRFSREHKAAQVLGIVMGIFIACWLPFFLFLLLTRICHFNVGIYQEELFRLFTWLGYTNSALNFLVYAFTSREFRLAFVKLLCPRSYFHRSIRTSSQSYR